MKIFLDANVLFSASNAGSNIHAFIHLISDAHELVTSDYAYEEARRNIYAKRKAWVPTFEVITKSITQLPSAPLYHDVVLVDKDRPILGAAIAHACDYLLTGDKKDFGHLYGTRIDTVTVIDYVRLAKILLSVATPTSPSI